jgi:hypothetical protein
MSYGSQGIFDLRFTKDGLEKEIFSVKCSRIVEVGFQARIPISADLFSWLETSTSASVSVQIKFNSTESVLYHGVSTSLEEELCFGIDDSELDSELVEFKARKSEFFG